MATLILISQESDCGPCGPPVVHNIVSRITNDSHSHAENFHSILTLHLRAKLRVILEIITSKPEDLLELIYIIFEPEWLFECQAQDRVWKKKKVETARNLNL